MKEKYPNIHISEWGWINEVFDYNLENNGSLVDLHNHIDEIIETQKDK